jgi:general secretion pathway protein A
MYTDFFGLKRNPFELSPDPSFMFPSEQSREALAAISYAIVRRKGFVVMTGEVGTGKTLVVRSLFDWWNREGIAFANIFAPKLSVIDFLTYATSDLGIEVSEPSKGSLLRALYGFVAGQFEKGLTTVLVVDEAHQIPTEMLEEIRMLTNVETNEQKLVQVLLIGQPELDTKLDSFELRQLKQRIAVRCHLEPLREEETCRYIECRLSLAGASAEAKTIFPPETTKAIYRYSQGIPRLINAISDRALITAYARQIRVVPVEVVNDVVSYFRIQPSSDLRQTKTLPPQSHQAGDFTAVMSRQPTTTVSASAARATDPNTLSTDVVVRGGTPAEVTPPSKRTPVREDSLPSIPSLAEQELATPLCAPVEAGKQLSGHDSRELSGLDLASPNEEPRALGLPSEPSAPSAATTSVTGLAQARSSRSIQYSPPTTESIPGEFDDSLYDTRPDPLLRRLEAALRDRLQGWARQTPTVWKKALLITAGGIVGIGLATDIVARRQNQGLTVLQNVAAAPETFQTGRAGASLQSTDGSSAIEFKAGSADTIVPRSDIEISKSAGKPGNSTRRTGIVMGKLPRPALKSPRLSISTEPPLIIITGMQTSELPQGNGLLVSPAPAPTPPGGGDLQPPKLVSSSSPVYPSLARAEKLQGVAVIDALVDATGKVTDMKAVSGPTVLTQAAMEALRTWKYEPQRLNGQPIAAHIKVSVNFSLP